MWVEGALDAPLGLLWLELQRTASTTPTTATATAATDMMTDMLLS